jgi:hypothetical protein
LLKVMTLECLLALLSRAQWTQVGCRHAHFGFKNRKGLFGAPVTLHDFELIAVVKFQCGLQGKEMLLSIIALRGFGNLLGAALDLGDASSEPA